MTTPTPYTSRIIKASALLADTHVLLGGWDTTRSVEENLRIARHENVFAKATRSRVEDISIIFRQRYFDEPELGPALVAIARSSLPGQVLDRLLYVATARSDRLLHDLVTELLVPMREAGQTEVTPADVDRCVQTWVREGKTVKPWGEETVRRVIRNSLAALRDFGVLAGANRKRIIVPSVPIEAFAFLAMLFSREEPSGDRLRRHPDWQLLFLDEASVERMFVEAHQRHVLSYYAAGSVVRIDFPVSTLEEYAHALAR